MSTCGAILNLERQIMTDFSYQLYSSRNFHSLSETLKMIAELGYKQVEGYGGLYENNEALQELKNSLEANKLRMTTGHFSMEMVSDESSMVREIASTLNMQVIIVPYLPEQDRPTNAADWRSFGKRLVSVGEKFWSKGLDFGWHNHDFEFIALETGEMPIDLILEADNRLAFEFDIAWCVKANEDPLTWIEKYSDRIIAAHLKDIAAEGDCIDEDGWADLGEGIMNWSAIWKNLNKTNTKYFIMEHDNPNDEQRFAERSIEAARTL